MNSKLPADLALATTPRAPPSAVQMVICPVCRQRFNLSNLMDAYHHGPEPHEPTAPNRS